MYKLLHPLQPTVQELDQNMELHVPMPQLSEALIEEILLNTVVTNGFELGGTFLIQTILPIGITPRAWSDWSNWGDCRVAYSRLF